MADNIAITAGSGTTVATREKGGSHYQLLLSGITTIVDGRTVVTTAGTRVALAGSTACSQVILTAETDNTGLVVVGAAATVVAAIATRRGIPLAAGDSLTLEIDNLADIGLDSTVNGDGVTFVYFT